MFGSAGTGKTLILTETLKIKLSKLLSLGRRVRILVNDTEADQPVGVSAAGDEEVG